MAVKREFILNRQGKDFVLWAGLLDAATDAGLVSLVSEVVVATAELAMFKATATFADGRVFTAHGDATPDNVGKTIVPHFFRMGETRAFARALRNALNIGAASLEEMGDDDAPAAPVATRPRQQAPPPRQQPTPIRPAADRPLPESADDVDWKQLGEPRDPALMAGAVTGATPLAPPGDEVGLRERFDALVFEAQSLGLKVASNTPPNAVALAKANEGLEGMISRAKAQASAPSGRGGRGR